MSELFYKNVGKFDVGLGVFGADVNGFFKNFNSFLGVILKNFNFGPVKVDVVEVGKLFQALNDVGLYRV